MNWCDDGRQLDDRSKLLLEGKYILGKSDEELAEELSKKPASVRMALTRARQCAISFLLMSNSRAVRNERLGSCCIFRFSVSLLYKHKQAWWEMPILLAKLNKKNK